MSKTPKLRFKEFSGDWEEKKLSNYTEKIIRKNKEFLVTNVISNSSKNGLISQRDFFDKDIANQNNINGYYIVENGDFVYNPRKSIESPYGPVNRYNLKDTGVVSPLYLCFKINDKINGKFLEYYFKSSKWYRFIYQNSDQGARHDRVNIKDSEFFKLNSKVPSLQEQEKIASFLSLIDDKISLQSDKVEALKDYKKGIMQKIFSRELRFKDDDGSDYPEWEVITIEKVANLEKGFTPNTKNEKNWIGDVPWLSIADMKQGKYVSEVSKYISNEALGKKALVPKGTLIMSFKLTLGRLAIINRDLMTNEAICHFYWRNKNINTEYMYYYLSTSNIESFGCRAAKGITLNNDSLNSIVVKLPVIKEQNKISDILTKIDYKLQKEQEKLDSLTEYKKGLLQQMFV